MEKINNMITEIDNIKNLNEKFNNIKKLNVFLLNEKNKLNNYLKIINNLEEKKTSKTIDEIENKFNNTNNIDKQIKLYQNLLYIINKEINSNTLI